MLNRLGHRQLDHFRMRFSTRDLAILASLREHRFLTAQQIIRLHFYGHATQPAGARACSRVLERLQRLRTIARIQRRIGGTGGGSTSQVWTLDINGHRLLTQNKTGRSHFDPSLTFLAHTLAVAETRVTLEEIARRNSLRLAHVEIEQTAWRQFIGTGGQSLWLKPDLAAVLSDDEFDDRWFIEVDLGTESLKTLLGKCAVYESYRKTGKEQASHEVFPRVLWLTTTQRRADQLRNALANSRSLHPRLFTVARFDEIGAIITDQPPLNGKEERA
ncbi:replication-relaxation family protein [Agreia sp. VKM Ac-1783]|uniref:replication-relaxation family protein n=1 Tax=Agreia sp. VKM Ac-1783 TaxID=1938889 RepID=UPI000A2ABCDD|nr:replication-relaxation family protein [Agreia sp. VKM Ac-1783]SMQ71882.1 Replication-relaxation [Agreia sp. VKM Ac-1783]